MGTFTPPTEFTGSPILAEPHEGNRLMRHYDARPVGRNVYIYSDDTVSEVDPNGLTTLWEPDALFPNAAHVVRFFQGGGGPYEVTAAEEVLLEAAGFTVED